MRIKFIKEYAYAHRGVQIERFAAGQIVDNPPAGLAGMALADGAVIDPDQEAPEPEEKPAKRSRKG
jgi:hypothetical protein